MKRIPESAMAQTALAKGAVIQLGSRKINAAAEQVDLPRPHPAAKHPAPEPAPAPEPPHPPADFSGLERAAQAQLASTDRMLQLVAALLQEQRQRASAADARPQAGAEPLPVAKRTSWRFEFEHDRSGRPVAITAHPIET